MIHILNGWVEKRAQLLGFKYVRALGGAILLLQALSAQAQAPGFWTDATFIAGGCAGCHGIPAGSGSLGTGTPMPSLTTAVVEAGASDSNSNFKTYFNSIARPNGSPMTVFCGDDTVSCQWSGAGAASTTQITSLRHYLMDVIDGRAVATRSATSVSISSGAGSRVETKTSPSAGNLSSTINFGLRAQSASASSDSVTFTLDSGRGGRNVSRSVSGNTANFQVSALSCSSVGDNYSSACTFTVRFVPGFTGGAKTATLVISMTGATDRYVRLTGTTNTEPTAGSGGPYSGVRNVAIALTGSSSDPDVAAFGDSLSYAWTIRNAATSAVVTTFNTQSPSFTTATAGNYTATLVVSDAFGGSTTSSAANITVTNSSPSISNFTPSSPATAATAAPAYNFTATATDANGDALTYTWEYKAQASLTWVQLATGSSASSSGTLAVPAGTYDARVTVSDSFNSVISASTFVVPNKAPVVAIGTPSISGTTTPAPVSVQITGSTASDPNGVGDALSLQWSIQGTSGPAARTLTSQGTLPTATITGGGTSLTPTFSLLAAGTYTVTLRATDSSGAGNASSTTTTTLTVANTAPVASVSSTPGTSGVVTGQAVALNGTGSSDANGDALTYAWTLQKPATSGAALSSASVASPSFTPDVAGSYTASLTVTDTSAATSVQASTTLIVQPVAAATPTSASPSTQVGGTPQQVTFTVRNSGNAPLNINSFAITAAAGMTDPSIPGDYSFVATAGSCVAGSTVLAGTPASATTRSSCDIVVQFTPTVAANRFAVLTILHNDNATSPAGTTTVALNGTGQPSTVPILDLGSTSTLGFGSVLQGANSQLSFTIRNGNAFSGSVALQLSTLSISNTAAGTDFAFVTGGAGACTATTALAGGASCTVTVRFTPQAAGPRTGTVSVATTNGGSASVSLTGTGVALADATLSGVPLPAFPSTLVTTTSATTGTVTINNPRANSLTYGTAFGGTNAADFQIGSESCATRVVPAGGSCTAQVRFTPANGAAGTRSATLVFAFVGFGTDPNPATLSTALSGTAQLPAPAFSVSSNSLSFAAVVLSPTTTSAVVTNTGTAALSLSNLSFAGAQSGDFRLDATNGCTASTTLAPSSSCTLVVLYDPVTAGASAATLTLTSNAANSPHTLALSGTATPTPRPRILLSDSSLAFGSFMVGTSSSATITVQNSGNAALNFSGFPISGAAPGDFARTGSCAVGTAIAPAASCTLTVSFNPTAAGSRTASLTVNSDASNGASVLISLSGTGVPIPAPVVTLTAVSGLPLEFGSQTVGGLYPDRRVTLTNSGTAMLVISALTVEGAGFSEVNTGACPANLDIGLSCDIDIKFTPTAAATDYNGNVRVVSNAAGSPHLAALHGRGTAAAVPSVVWLPLVSRLDYGQVVVGSVSPVQSATLRNAGPGGLRLTLLNAVGPDAAAFSVTAGDCAIGDVLFEGQTCRVDIRFAPGSSGTKTANVQVASSGSFPSDLTLTGVGMGGPNPGLALSVRTLSLGTVRVGAGSVPAELTLAANGSGVVRVTAFSASAGFTVQSKSCPALPFSLPAGSECTVTVVFTPRAAGAVTGQLTVTSDATNGTTQQVALTGSGEAAPEVSSGGCSIVQGESALDPTLWLLVLMAMGGIAYRRRLRQQARRPRA